MHSNCIYCNEYLYEDATAANKHIQQTTPKPLQFINVTNSPKVTHLPMHNVATIQFGLRAHLLCLSSLCCEDYFIIFANYNKGFTWTVSSARGEAARATWDEAEEEGVCYLLIGYSQASKNR